MRVQRVLPLAVGVWLAASPVLGGSQPLTVSPGDTSKLVLIPDACPTFSWGEVEGTESYELVVYRLREEGEEARPAFRQRFLGAVTSWTPSLGQCLRRGERYAWTVRAVGSETPSDWSAPSLFQVASGPSQAEFETALATVQSYLDRGVLSVPGSGVVDEGQAKPESEPEASAENPVPLVSPAGTELSVAGNVDAASFSGSGTSLTSLNPANLSAGVAGIDITGTAASVSGVVPIVHGGTGATNSGDACTNLGAALAADLTTHESEAFVHHPDLPIGTIVIWTGVVVPDGWALCDGQTVLDRNGQQLVTPDLRDRFVVGANTEHPLGSSGGVATHKHENYHDHGLSGATTEETTDKDGTQNGDSNSFADSDHTHSLSGSTSGISDLYTEDASNEPPWYGVSFIIKK